MVYLWWCMSVDCVIVYIILMDQATTDISTSLFVGSVNVYKRQIEERVIGVILNHALDKLNKYLEGYFPGSY